MSFFLFKSSTIGRRLPIKHSWTAICRGAVVHAIALNGLPGLSVGVQTRVSRVNCGFMWNEEWDPELHQHEDKTWNERRQEWEAKDQMKWLLKIVCLGLARCF